MGPNRSNIFQGGLGIQHGRARDSSFTEGRTEEVLERTLVSASAWQAKQRTAFSRVCPTKHQFLNAGINSANRGNRGIGSGNAG